MTTPHLSDRMHDLAAEVSAPPTSAAREAVGRRARTLRRRHRARQAAGGGLLVAVVTAGVLIADRTPAPDGVDPGPADVATPALTVDLAGWEVTGADQMPLDLDVGPDQWTSGALQVFRQPGNLTGPTVFLRHSAASDTVVPPPGEAVTFTAASGNEVDAWLIEQPDATFVLRWSDGGDWAGEMLSWGLTRDEVLAFAAGLRPVDDRISYPPVDEQFGFTAAVLPAGIVEVPAEESPPDVPQQRRLTAAADAAAADVVVDDGTTVAVESELRALVAEGGALEPVTVLGRPAVLGEVENRWIATWFQSADAAATVTFTNADRATVDAVLAGLRELPEAEWDELRTDHRVP